MLTYIISAASILISLATIIVNVRVTRRSKAAHKTFMAELAAFNNDLERATIRARRARGEGTGFDTEL